MDQPAYLHYLRTVRVVDRERQSCPAGNGLEEPYGVERERLVGPQGRWGHLEFVQVEELLAREVERQPRCGEHRETAAPFQQTRDVHGRLADVLEVVEQQQDPPLADEIRQPAGAAAFRIDARCDRIEHVTVVRHGRQLDQEHTVPEEAVVQGGGGCLERQARLAHAPYAGHRHQPRTAGEHVGEGDQFHVAADERRHAKGQVGGSGPLRASGQRGSRGLRRVGQFDPVVAGLAPHVRRGRVARGEQESVQARQNLGGGLLEQI